MPKLMARVALRDPSCALWHSVSDKDLNAFRARECYRVKPKCLSQRDI
jgi:hypothetical protein